MKEGSFKENELDDYLLKYHIDLWHLYENIEGWVNANEELMLPGYVFRTLAWQEVVTYIEKWMKAEIANKEDPLHLKKRNK